MRLPLVISAFLALLLVFGTADVRADPGITSPSTAAALAAAMDVPAPNIVSASLGTTDPLGTGVADTPLSFFPTNGGSFAILASGLASSADDPDTNNDECLGCGGAGDDVSYVLDGLNNSQGNDLVQLSLTLTVPKKFGCLAFDFAFYSEEMPDYIGSVFNDTFIAEVGAPGTASTFTIVGNDVVAPNNIAFDPNGHTLDVNSSFGFDPANPNPDTGTTYDGTSGLLSARTQVSPGSQIEIVFSIMDLGDSILDSAVFLDNFRWTNDPPELCQAGAEPAGLILPFDPGETWYVCQGYKQPRITLTHKGKFKYGLDLIPNAAGVGPNGCTEQSPPGTGSQVRAPAGGTVAWRDVGMGAMCINLSDNRSVWLGHMFFASDAPTVNADDVIGTVAPPQEDRQKNYWNGGVSHIHVGVYDSPCPQKPGSAPSQPIPFDAAHSATLGGYDLPDQGNVVNQYSGLALTRP